MFYVYVLQSIKDRKTYVGYTKKLEQRLQQHNFGQVVATKQRRPLELLFFENYESIQEAKKRELWWKGSSGRRGLKKIF